MVVCGGVGLGLGWFSVGLAGGVLGWGGFGGVLSVLMGVPGLDRGVFLVGCWFCFGGGGLAGVVWVSYSVVVGF